MIFSLMFVEIRVISKINEMIYGASESEEETVGDFAFWSILEIIFQHHFGMHSSTNKTTEGVKKKK